MYNRREAYLQEDSKEAGKKDHAKKAITKLGSCL